METESSGGFRVSRVHGEPTSKEPPDLSGDKRVQNERKATFKEKVLDVRCKERCKPSNLITQGIMQLELMDGNRLLPIFNFEEDEYQRICQPWEDCLVVKLLGKNLGYQVLSNKLRMMWKPVGGIDIIYVHHGYFLVKFEVATDREKVMAGAPWLIFDHYQFIKPWTKEFVAANDKINTTMVWIRIPGLGLQFYDESILLTLATAVGNPIKVDMNTLDMQRGRFARVCVEIDLDKLVVGKLCLRDTWYNIEYEDLDLLCS